MGFDPLRFCSFAAGEDSARQRRIQELAYLRAEQRGFAPRGELENWVWAENEVGRLSTLSTDKLRET
jgi:hypothetical protein